MKWIKLDSVTSTNSYITALIREHKAQEELVVITDYQEEGRGQGDHSWHSKKGQNLLMSMLLFPAFLSASNQFQLSRIVSLAILDILAAEGVDPIIKWPNDILTQQGKIAGILIENGIFKDNISHAIIGIGLNLNQTTFPDFPVRATSLQLETDSTYDVTMMAATLTNRILERYQQLKCGEGDLLEKEYLSRLYLMDQPALFMTEGKEFQGRIRGVNNLGELLVESAGTCRTYGHHQIRMMGDE